MNAVTDKYDRDRRKPKPFASDADIIKYNIKPITSTSLNCEKANSIATRYRAP